MAKSSKTVFYCTSCGYESPKWMGRCPACGEWNTFKEAPSQPKSASASDSSALFSSISSGVTPMPLSEIDCSGEQRIRLNMSEVDRLLGGGLVRGSLVLLGGEPGIGKSTLSLQIPLMQSSLRTLYVTGEESSSQVKMRSERLGGEASGCIIYPQTHIEEVIQAAAAERPDLMIVDSVQTMFTDRVDSTPGSVSQIKEVASMLLRYAKQSSVPVILIGHITKDGYIAGPKILEHIVDVVLQFEGDSSSSYRILRSIKNRFGSTSEIAVFEMTGSGLREVTNPSEMLIPMHEQGLSGTAIASTLDGSRPLLFEVQALVSSAAYGTAQRSATGFDARRLNMLLAVLEKRAGFKLSAKDVFLNMAGGLKVNDPACDLAVVSAVLSSNFDYPLGSDVCFAGEVGLSGEIRPVGQSSRRAAEAARLGFKKMFLSTYTSSDFIVPKGLEVVKVSDIPALVRSLFKA
ncbi:MAG: DNA repair protein RadA [Bacteroidales bacterium]|nr:DNA repair protein RadA [Bacteroidales bacterium]